MMLMSQITRLKARFGRFSQDTRGSVNIEALLFFPLLITLIASTIVFYDAFRRDSLAQKAAYTIGDMISRETEAINPTVVSSARDLVALMSDVTRDDVSVRVTQVVYNKAADEYRRNWSQRSGAHAPVLDNADLATMTDNLPIMVGGERIILVDVYVDFEWPIELGFDDFTYHTQVFTRPRFAPQLAWSNN